jgi:MYXO-CTERM domain-containing protein
MRFGIGTFPDGTVECTTGALRMPIAEGQGAQVATYVQQDGPDGEGTPIAASVEAISQADPALTDTTRDNFVLLVTDGAENCDGMPPVAVQGLMNRTPQVRTFVVGFGNGVDENELNAMADAGGTARMGDPRYYQADDRPALETALNEIAITVTGGDPEFATTCDDPTGGGGGSEEGGGSGGGGGGGSGTGEIGETPGACACQAVGHGSAKGAWLVAMLVMGVFRRRRRGGAM